MKKYKLLKELPWIEAWTEFTYNESDWMWWAYLVWWKTIWWLLDFIKWFWISNDFFEEITLKKTFDTLTVEDWVWYINTNWDVYGAYYRDNYCISEIFLTKEEAEDEHKRREWANRKDKFIPEEKETYFSYSNDSLNIVKDSNDCYPYDIFTINQWLAFRTEEECQDAIDNHDIVRLFYTIK